MARRSEEAARALLFNRSVLALVVGFDSRSTLLAVAEERRVCADFDLDRLSEDGLEVSDPLVMRLSRLSRTRPWDVPGRGVEVTGRFPPPIESVLASLGVSGESLRRSSWWTR